MKFRLTWIGRQDCVTTPDGGIRSHHGPLSAHQAMQVRERIGHRLRLRESECVRA